MCISSSVNGLKCYAFSIGNFAKLSINLYERYHQNVSYSDSVSYASLNGMVVDGHRWIAQPAPVFPPEVLQILWSRPDERKHVIAAIRSLLQNLRGPIDTIEVTDLTARYYGDGLTD